MPLDWHNKSTTAPMPTPPKPVRLAALIRPDQKVWLQSQVTPLRSLADVVREVIDQAIAREGKRRA